MDVAAGRVAGHALEADLLARLDPVADRDRDLAEVGVDAAIAVAVVDDDDERQVVPELLLVEDSVVGTQVADPADDVVELATGSQDDAVVSGPNGVAAERRDVDSVVEELAVLDPGAAGDRLERQRQTAASERPDVARQLLRRRRHPLQGGGRNGAILGPGIDESRVVEGRGEWRWRPGDDAEDLAWGLRRVAGQRRAQKHDQGDRERKNTKTQVTESGHQGYVPDRASGRNGSGADVASGTAQAPVAQWIERLTSDQ